MFWVFFVFLFFIERVPSELRSTHSHSTNSRGLRVGKRQEVDFYTSGRVTEMDQSSFGAIEKKNRQKGRRPKLDAWWWNHVKTYC